MGWILVSFRRSFDYSGRSRRREYWSYALFACVALPMISFIEKKLGLVTVDAEGRPEGPLSSVLLLVLVIPGLAVAVRRLHDSGRAGWWLLLPVVPILFWVVALVGGFSSDLLFKIVIVAIIAAPLAFLALMCVPGDKSPNRFGPSPKADELADIFA